MRIYLDDDMIQRHLVALLCKAGHHVVLPADVGLDGASDSKHFKHAIQSDLVLLTRNQRDYEELHEIVLACGGTHPGMLFVCAERDPRKHMTPKTIVAAVGKLEASATPLENDFHVLNHWR